MSRAGNNGQSISLRRLETESGLLRAVNRKAFDDEGEKNEERGCSLAGG